MAAGSYLREMAGTGGIADARNQIADAFLDKTEGEWLWFIDTDMGFPVDTVDRLVESADPETRPVVGGLAFAHRRVRRTDLRAERFGIIPTLYRWVELEDESGFAPATGWDRNTIIPVSGTGAACLLIHRTVLEKLREKYNTYFQPITHPTANKGARPRTFSEDLSFCLRLAALGITVYVNTSVKTTHHKGEVYLDEETYDKQAIDVSPSAKGIGEEDA